MFILEWWKQYLEIKTEYQASKRENQYCETCEALKMQLSIANQEKQQLLDRLLEVPKQIIEDAPKDIKPILPRHGLSFNARRQILEREDRAKAKVIERVRLENVNVKPSGIDNITPSTSQSVEKLEQELGITDALK